MFKQLKIASMFTLALGVLSSIGFVCLLVAYEFIRPLTLRFENPEAYGTWWETVIGSAILLSLFFHFMAMLTTILEIRYFGGESPFRRAVLIVTVISFMGVCGDCGLLSDIGKESAMGWEVASEWYILYLTMIPQVLAHVLVLFSMIRLRRYLKQNENSGLPLRDDTVFYTVHYTGLLCGAVGLWITIMSYITRTSISNLKNITVYYNVIILTPYLLLLGYWLLMKFRDRVADWYDEKQMADSMKAGFFALLISLPAMAMMYVIQYGAPGTPADVLWFPLYVHLVLVIFSGITLYLKEN